MRRIFIGLSLVVVSLIVLAGSTSYPHRVDAEANSFFITGRLIDSQGQPIVAAEIVVRVISQDEALAETKSQEDGSWSVPLPTIPAESLIVTIAAGFPPNFTRN